MKLQLSFAVAILFACAVISLADAPMQISGNGQPITRNCTGRSVQISGDSDDVKLTGHCRSLQVSGNHNSIRIDEADAIQTSGTGNAVTWLHGEPAVQDTGTANVVGPAGSGGHSASAHASSTGDGSTTTAEVGGAVGDAANAATDAAAAVAGRVTAEQTDGKGLHLVMSKQAVQRECKDGENVEIVGYQDDVTLSGACGTVSLNGWCNQVHIEAVDQINLTGHTNTITWAHARTGHRPKVNILNGYENNVRQGS
jgi:hypothetical protein